jgi:diguanylate cyclase (GGDEF)-like protein
VVADITVAVESERKLRRLAHSDTLTGLANRLTLRDALDASLRAGEPCALLSIDLDRFKVINDSFGHSVGDQVLRAVAGRLRHCVRADDVLARLGGDEFAVLLPRVDDEGISRALAERMVEALGGPIDIDGRGFHVGLSIGIALSRGEPAGFDELLVRADTAMYAVNEAGRGGFTGYSPQMGERSRRRACIEEGLRNAIDGGQLRLHWQPRTDVAAWRVTGAEALLRWSHPTLGRINPAEFIAIAEQAGMIENLGRWALREACRVATSSLDDLVVSVNVSPIQLRGGRFVGEVRDALREFAMAPSRLELEITESVLIDEEHGALAQLHALRALGIRVALDDFGTGYYSLAYLRRFPFDTLKIDRAFVSEALTRKDALAIIHMIVQLASTLGMRTLSEGVETAQQLDAISAAGCDEIQGYYVSAPMALDDFVAWRRDWSVDRNRPAKPTMRAVTLPRAA